MADVKDAKSQNKPSWLKVVSWNIDKLNANKWSIVKEYLKTNQPALLCLNETKDTEANLVSLLSQQQDYNYIINTHNPTRYHGVALLIRKDIKCKQIDIKMNFTARQDSKDPDPCKGRLLAVCLEDKYIVVATYSPNAGTGLKYLDYRMQWDSNLHKCLNQVNQSMPVVWIGDINVAHQDIDVSNPKTMKTWPGYTPQERANLDQLLNTGWCDIWRKTYPRTVVYTWNGKKSGMRLDSCIISADCVKYVASSFVDTSAKVISDHIPVGLDLLM